MLGLETVPALIVPEKNDRDVLVQMFNIHLVREPWKDIPTALALGKLADDLSAATGEEPTDQALRDVTGLSIERVKRLRYALTLPQQWQDYINDEIIPLNFFWELKRNVIDLMATKRPGLAAELGGLDAVMAAFVDKRLGGVITDTVALRKVRPIINYAAQDAEDGSGSDSVLDETIRDLVNTRRSRLMRPTKILFRSWSRQSKLEARLKATIITFERLLGKARTDDDVAFVKRIGQNFIQRLRPLVADE